MRTLHLSTPPDFKFLPTVLSHGWCELPPFNFDETTKTLERVQQLASGRIVKLRVTGDGHGVSVVVQGAKDLSREDAAEILSVVRVCLSVDRELKPFYAEIGRKPRYRWVSRVGAGRLLISPTVWEDLAKTLLTTNTTWNVTVQMCRRIAALGPKYNDGTHAFPTPKQVAAMSVAELTAAVRAGYRSAYLSEMAKRIADGSLDIETWRNPEIPSADLYKRLRGIKGFGEYAAGSMLRLLGRFDRLGLDTSSRDVFRAQLNDGKKASDAQIAKYYEAFGAWQGLALWMDVMKVNLTKRLQLSSKAAGV